MADDYSEHNKCSILNQLESHLEAIESIVKDAHGLQENGPGQGHETEICEIVECRLHSASSLSSISDHIQAIRKVMYDEEKSNRQTKQADILTSREQALNNPLVLGTIVKYLDGPSLFCMRLVNKLWKEEATFQLRSACHKNKQGQNYNTNFWWDSKEHKFKAKRGRYSLEDFSEQFYTPEPSKFPCSEFYFHGVSSEHSSGLVHFLSTHGHHIKNLHLHTFSDSPDTCSLIRQIIFEWTPFLKFLKLELPLSFLFTRRRSPEDEEGPQLSRLSKPLPNLTELCVCVSGRGKFDPLDVFTMEPRIKQLVTDVLSTASNLTRLSDPGLQFTEEIAATDKARVIYRASLGGYGRIHRTEHLSPICPLLTLTHLKLRQDCFPTSYETPSNLVISTIVRILESSRSSLKTLDLEGPLIWTMDNNNNPVEIPVLENLEELKLTVLSKYEDGGGRILPEGCTLQNNFPRLQTLTFGRLNNGNPGPGSANPLVVPCNSSTTVIRLTFADVFGCNFDPDFVRQAPTLYPNVRFLHLRMHDGWLKLPQFLTAIWESWADTPVEEISMNLDHLKDYEEVEDRYTEAMDVAMTGFDEDACRRLRSGPVEGDLGVERGSSVFNMKKLKLLKLTGESPHSGPGAT